MLSEGTAFEHPFDSPASLQHHEVLPLSAIPVLPHIQNLEHNTQVCGVDEAGLKELGEPWHGDCTQSNTSDAGASGHSHINGYIDDLEPRLSDTGDQQPPLKRRKYSASFNTGPKALSRPRRKESLFPTLPTEVRLMIWELTWPAARVIEAAYEPLEDDDSEDDDDTDDTDDVEDVGNNTEFTILRPTGSFTSFLQENFGESTFGRMSSSCGSLDLP
jgi:hypothetical protein